MDGDRDKKIEEEYNNMGIYGNGKGALGVEARKQWKWFLIALKWSYLVYLWRINELTVFPSIIVFVGVWLVIRYS
ncbi:MAG: hypothetical protein ABIJ10_05560 [Candidatus Micrarchaeota archaeon]